MYQQSLDLRDRFSEQLCLDLNVPVEMKTRSGTLYCSSDTSLSVSEGFTGTVNSYLTVNNTNGVEQARIDDTGLSLKVENKTWLKTKVANWLGMKYL